MANILVQWLVTGVLAALHPFFVSVLDINHNKKEDNLEISIRVFADDMERVLQKYTSKKIDLPNPSDKTFLESQISSYISQKVQLKVNGQPAAMKYLGYEIQKESAWIYLEVPATKTLNTLDIICKLLYDLETSQTNLVHAKSGSEERNYKLDNPNNAVSFRF